MRNVMKEIELDEKTVSWVVVLEGGGRSEVRFMRNVPQNVSASVGQQAVLRCRVLNLGNHTVSAPDYEAR